MAPPKGKEKAVPASKIIAANYVGLILALLVPHAFASNTHRG